MKGQLNLASIFFFFFQTGRVSVAFSWAPHPFQMQRGKKKKLVVEELAVPCAWT